MPLANEAPTRFFQPPAQKEPFVKSRVDPASSRIISLVLGIVGGVIGILVGLVMLLAGSFSQSLSLPSPLLSTVAISLYGVCTLLLGILGIVGGAVASTNPDFTKWCTAIASIVYLIVALADFSATWVLSGALLLGTVLLAVAYLLAKDASVTPVRAVIIHYGDPSLPVAGWYPDPVEEQKLRFWDGANWTDFRAGRRA